MTPADLDRHLAEAQTNDHGPGGRMRRIVVRMPPDDVARLDVARRNFPKASRAAMLRAFTLAGLAAIDALRPSPPPPPLSDASAPEGSAP